jgi:hypothetical protein
MAQCATVNGVLANHSPVGEGKSAAIKRRACVRCHPAFSGLRAKRADAQDAVANID